MTSRRARDRGTSLVEFAMVMTLLFFLLFGIISFGIVFSFKQTVTSAAHEAARAAATTENTVAVAPLIDDGVDERVVAAQNAIARFESWGRNCSDPAMVCDILVHDCGGPTQSGALPDCITVTMSYDYDSSPIIPDVPLVASFLPDEVTNSATAQLTFGGP